MWHCLCDPTSEVSFQETAPKKTAENIVKHRNGGVGSVIANHRGGGESSMVVRYKVFHLCKLPTSLSAVVGTADYLNQL